MYSRCPGEIGIRNKKSAFDVGVFVWSILNEKSKNGWLK